MNEFGNIIHKNSIKIAIITSRFNELITSALLKGAKEALKKEGIQDEDLSFLSTPGAFELPLAAKLASQSKKYEAIICLGAVIRGSTPHFDYVCQGVTQGIMQVMLESQTPIAFGILTTNSLEEALDRAGGKSGNKGYIAALTALEMAALKTDLRL